MLSTTQDRLSVVLAAGRNGRTTVYTGSCLRCGEWLVHIYSPWSAYWSKHLGPFCSAYCSNKLARKSSGYLNKGYKVLSDRGVRKYEHRQIFEAKLGRRLKKCESVHHKNGNRSDNRLSNLELWTSYQPYGQRPKDLIKFVVKNYKKEVELLLDLIRS